MKLAFDPVLKRPACVLIAATLGGDLEPVHNFPVESWLLSPTPDMQVFETSQDQLIQLVRMVETDLTTSV